MRQQWKVGREATASKMRLVAEEAVAAIAIVRQLARIQSKHMLQLTADDRLRAKVHVAADVRAMTNHAALANVGWALDERSRLDADVLPEVDLAAACV